MKKPNSANWLTARNGAIALAVLALVVVVVGAAASLRTTRQARRFSQRLRDGDNAAALQVVQELRARGALQDGYMKYVSMLEADLYGVDFHQANLEGGALSGANLGGADLRGANLSRAYLKAANLADADLSGANLAEATLWLADLSGAYGLTDEQLRRADELRGATMPDGTPYDGRYILPRDIREATGMGIDLDDPEAMAALYGVPLEDYQRGQEWAQANLEAIRPPDGARYAPVEVGPVEPGAVAVLASVVFSVLAALLVWDALPPASPGKRPDPPAS